MTMLLPFPSNEDRPFAERLRNFRDLRGFSRADLASELDVTPITVHRWETGSTLPSPHLAEKLHALGFGALASAETNVATVPRLGKFASKKRTDAVVEELRDAGRMTLGSGANEMVVLGAPFVRNGPPDQTAFHRRLLELQASSSLPSSTLGGRMSMVEEVLGAGPTAQHQLERPRPTAVSWNSNYGTHGWHRYVGRFPAHVVRALLNHFGADGRSVVCDPFVGSGTTAVECRLLGIPFVGIEICPLSAMMTRTKAAFPEDPKLLKSLAQRFVTFYDAKWQEFIGKRDPTKLKHLQVLERKGNRIPAFANVERWFTAEALLGTSIAVEFGMKQSGFAREAVFLALSSKMRSIGNVDVDVVRAEYSKTPRKDVDVGSLVTRQLTKMGVDIAASYSTHASSITPNSAITILEGSALDVDIAPGSIDYVITSPPYGVEAISYLRTHLLSYRSLVAHLGHDPYDTRDKTIGSEYVTENSADAGRLSRGHSATCEMFFERTAANHDTKYQQRRAGMMQFCDDMLAIGERMACWIKKGGKVAFIIGNKRLGDDIMPMDVIVSELFASCGFKLLDSIQHKLKTNNSNSQVPWQERIIQEESILLFARTST
jgi:transcriptional regulator with XRE-family HTH domain/DNA modification methylase